MQDTIYPVIMCGGAGTRLWPASRPSRPKQFIDLTGPLSLFQDTALRAAPLAGEHGRLIVVGGVRHGDSIRDQLAAIGLSAIVLLEPVARDSAAAMAAAAAWVARHDPTGILAVIASDHHIPDTAAFQSAVRIAVATAAQGRIVTLGVTPTEASPAYGYIKPTQAELGAGLGPIAAFVEKPDRETAARYVAEGYLWNSGNFIVSARTLIDELSRHAPAVIEAATAALPPQGFEPIQALGEVFGTAPAISIDYAVMEKTQLASVLAVDFAWSDLGAWDAVAATGQTAGQTAASVHTLEDADGCVIRAPEGVMVALLGVSNIAVIVEKDAVLVCDMARSQEVKRVVERVRAASPGHLDLPMSSPEALADSGRRFAEWLRLKALPAWSTLGMRHDGAFAEALTLDVRPVSRPRRARVQTRQIYVYAKAGIHGWAGPWRTIVQAGLGVLRRDFIRPDGLLRTLVTQDGGSLDETVMVYDQAFALLALATAKAAGLDDGTLESAALAIREGLLQRPSPHGPRQHRGVPESGDHPYQANAHMHLLEACLAWEAAGDDPGWATLADQIVELALEKFIDAEGGFLREFFAPDWSPAAGPDGRLVEPGHQFEWAWLLTGYGRARSDARAHAAARRLYATGRRGVSRAPEFVLDALEDDGAIRSADSRLWPHTEWIKAALILAEDATADERMRLLDDAALALRALWRYLTPDGVWRERRKTAGGFVDEPAPASSLYHIIAAFDQLVASSGRSPGLPKLDLV